MGEDELAIMIPIIAVTLSLGIPIIAIITDYKRRRVMLEGMHKERLAAIERGVDVPPMPPELLSSVMVRREVTPVGYLFRAMVWAAIGLTLLLPLADLIGGQRVAAVGWMPLGIGFAYLVRAIIEHRSGPRRPRDGGST
ncbi:MAG: hypothetical protein R3E77_01085 [Steroidobacteraceae bacterium]